MEGAVDISNGMSVKASIKCLLIALPIFGLLMGIGIGLIVGNVTFATPLDLYARIETMLLPSLALMVFMLSYVFRKINSI